jgi:hypothetical protein
VHWSVAIAAGAVMLTYSLTLGAVAEILKANVSSAEAAAAATVFAVTSIVTIAAPVAVVVLAPQRSAEILTSWRTLAPRALASDRGDRARRCRHLPDRPRRRRSRLGSCRLHPRAICS